MYKTNFGCTPTRSRTRTISSMLGGFIFSESPGKTELVMRVTTRDDVLTVFSLATGSRVVVITLAFLSQWIVKPYDRSSLGSRENLFGGANVFADGLTGLSNWDGVYFSRIAEVGYEHENEFAFFPLYPSLVDIVQKHVLSPLLSVRIGPHVSYILAGVLISNVSFVVACVFLFLLSKEVLRDRSLALRSSLLFCISPASIFMSSVYTESLFALASFTGLYFMALSRRSTPATSRVHFLSNWFYLVCCTLCFAVASATRSNGTLLCCTSTWEAFVRVLVVFVWPGVFSRTHPPVTSASLCIVCLPATTVYLGWDTFTSPGGAFNVYIERFLPECCPSKAIPSPNHLLASNGYNSWKRRRGARNRRNANRDRFLSRQHAQPQARLPGWVWVRSAVCQLSLRGALCAVVLAPYALFQVYAHQQFCATTAPGEGRPWCSWRVPSLYPFVQSHYWGVGAFKYYTLKQLPNFILALPMIVLSMAAIVSFWRYVWTSGMCLCGITASRKHSVSRGERTAGEMEKVNNNVDIDVKCSQTDKPSIDRATAFPNCGGSYGFFINIQVVPFILHWTIMVVFGVVVMHVQVLTRFVSCACPPLYWYAATLLRNYPVQPNNGAGRGANINKTTVSMTGRLVVGYFLTYVVLGSVMFPTFYPWT